MAEDAFVGGLLSETDCRWKRVAGGGAPKSGPAVSLEERRGSAFGALDVGSPSAVLTTIRGCRPSMCGGTMILTPFSSTAGL